MARLERLPFEGRTQCVNRRRIEPPVRIDRRPCVMPCRLDPPQVRGGTAESLSPHRQPARPSRIQAIETSKDRNAPYHCPPNYLLPEYGSGDTASVVPSFSCPRRSPSAENKLASFHRKQRTASNCCSLKRLPRSLERPAWRRCAASPTPSFVSACRTHP